VLSDYKQVPRYVNFTTTTNYPLPNPEYLKIHAACARVAHLSGAGECMDKVIKDANEIPVLASDGTSAEVLEYALMNSLILAY
jgi:hypothetical protein